MTHMPSPQERAFADLDRQLSHIDIDFESIWSAKVVRRRISPPESRPSLRSGIGAWVTALAAIRRDRARKRR